MREQHALRSSLLLELGAILLLAAVLRLDDVTQPLNDAFSWREASTAMMADNFHRRSSNILYPEVSWTGPGPSYQGREFQVISYLTALLYRFVGWHDWLGRAVAACFGLWSVLALHWLVERLHGRTHANAAALTLAIMPGAIFIDRSFLPDPAMLALVTTGLWCFVAWLQGGKAQWLLIAIVATALGILAKLPGISVLPAMAYGAWTSGLRHRPPDRRAALIALVCVLVPVAAYYAWAIHLGRSYPPYHIAGSGYLWEDPVGVLRHGFHLRRALHHANLWLLAPPLILLCGVGFLMPPTSRSPIGPWLFHVWLIAAAAVFMAAPLELTNNPWNLLVFTGPAAVMGGRAILLLAQGGSGSRTGWS